MKQRGKERDNIHFNEFKNSQYDHDDKNKKKKGYYICMQLKYLSRIR